MISNDKYYLSKKKWKEDNIEKARLSNREYMKRNKEKTKQWMNNYNLKHNIVKLPRQKRNKKDIYLAKHQREKINYPERINAWKNDYKKKKDYCELCGSKEKLEFHHIDYITHSGITVCFNCHRYKIHNKKLKGGI